MRIATTAFILTFLSTPVFAQPTNPKPFVLGVIEEIHSTQLAEKRTLNIYLPEGYNDTDTIKYPVIYLLDKDKKIKGKKISSDQVVDILKKLEEIEKNNNK